MEHTTSSRPGLWITIGIAVGAVAGGFAVYFIMGVYQSVRDVLYMSQLEVPVRMSLEDIVSTYDAGDTELAEAKVRLLEARWQAYSSTRDLIDLNQPEELHIAIAEIERAQASATTMPTTRP